MIHAYYRSSINSLVNIRMFTGYSDIIANIHCLNFLVIYKFLFSKLIVACIHYSVSF